MWYIIIIAAANIIIAALSSLIYSSPFSYSLISSLLGTASVIAVDGVGAFLIRALPEKYFCAENTLPVGKEEKKFYKKSGIKTWKKAVPELGCFTGFHKDRLKSASDKEYLARFILEANYGIIIHIVNAITGYVIILLPFCKDLSISLPVAVVNMFLSLMPAAILRNNNPALLRAYIRAK